MMTYDVNRDDIITSNKLVFNRLNHIMKSNKKRNIIMSVHIKLVKSNSGFSEGVIVGVDT